ncbi:MAG: zf-HC2 domain-containing protein [Pyrinomonadaceae bacterium]
MDSTIIGKLKWQLILFLARRLPDCKTLTPTLSESIDRKLSLKERIVVRLHLFTCEACVRYLEQIRLLHDLIHDHRSEQVMSSLNETAKERMKAALASIN